MVLLKSVSFVTDFHEASLSAFATKSHLPASCLHLIVKTSMRLKKREGGRREDPVLAWQRRQGVSTEPGTRFPDKFRTYLVTKGRFVLGTDCWNKSLECSALCLVSLG